MKVQPVLLSGGSGTRLWPLSREAYPKQFLPLAGEHTMLQDTWLRVAPLAASAPIVVANEEHRFLAGEQLRLVGVEHADIVLEPVGRNTAPAIAAAALRPPPAATIRCCWCCRPTTWCATPTASAPRSPRPCPRPRPARWSPSASCRPRRRPVSATSRPGRARASARCCVSSRSPTRPPRAPTSTPAAITGTAACSWSAPRATWPSSNASVPTSWPRCAPRSAPPRATATSSASTARPSPPVRPIRSTTR